LFTPRGIGLRKKGGDDGKDGANSGSLKGGKKGEANQGVGGEIERLLRITSDATNTMKGSLQKKKKGKGRETY